MEFYIPFLLKSLLASISAVSIHLYINYFKNKTIISNNQIAVAVLFSPAVYIITLSISDNLALSLGMIGALSIVRFRNPVKSPLELVMFFALLTIGISASVNVRWSAYLVLLIILIFIFIHFYNKILNLFNKSAYEISFSEGNENNIMEVTSLSKIKFLESHKNLKSLIFDNQKNEYTYRLVIENKNEFKEIILKIEDIENCSYNANFS